MNIDNDKKTRIALKSLVTFGDYEEQFDKSYQGFSHLLEKCKSKDSTVDDFRMLEHMTFQLQSDFLNLGEDINEILSSTGYESKTNTDEVSRVMSNKFPGWYVNKVLVDTDERLKKEHTDLYTPRMK